MRKCLARVVFMCGPAGSGKSTVARRLEAEGFVRLSFDIEAWRRGIKAMPLSDEERTNIEDDLKRRLLEVVAAGHDVVLDFSFWSRRMRDEYRMLLAPLDVTPETIYVDTPRAVAVAVARVEARRQAHPDDFQIASELAAGYFDSFEPPSPDEGPLTIISGAT
jgi:predicted kinase